MTDSFRALCAELISNLQLILSYFESDECGTSDSEELIERGLALLDQPEPIMAKVTHEQLLRLKEVFSDSITRPWQVCISLDSLTSTVQIACSDVDQQDIEYIFQGHEPIPQPPADGEVAELVAWLRETGDLIQPEHLAEHQRYKRTAELLQRQHPQPVPVAIPGEEYHEDMGPVTWWRLPVEEPPWVGTPNDSDWPGYHTHFTPAPPTPCNAHALPLPTSEEG